MKRIFTIALVIGFIGCSLNDWPPEYPDCIPEPDNPRESSGCGDVMVYQSLDPARALVVEFDVSKVLLTEICQTVDLATQAEGISARLELSRGAPDSVYFNYCNDFGVQNFGRPIVYHAAAGRLTYSASENDPVNTLPDDDAYRITIRIEDLRLVNPQSGDEIAIPQVVFWDVLVGWHPG